MGDLLASRDGDSPEKKSAAMVTSVGTAIPRGRANYKPSHYDVSSAGARLRHKPSLQVAR